MNGSNITTPKATPEWGSKARKVEARRLKATHRKSAIRDARERLGDAGTERIR